MYAMKKWPYKWRINLLKFNIFWIQMKYLAYRRRVNTTTDIVVCMCESVWEFCVVFVIYILASNLTIE